MYALTFVVPCYNERENIAATVRDILAVADALPGNPTADILVVDDHSSDGTFEVVSSLADPRISCLRLSRRSGSHIALRAGIRQAVGDAVICIAGDGQDDPKLVGPMVAKWREGAHVVWALRQNRENEPRHQRLQAKVFYALLVRLSGGQQEGVDLSRADFFLLDRKVVEAINSCPERNTSLMGLIAWMGFHHDFVEYHRGERRLGKSKWNFSSRLRLAADWLIAFSGVPLRLMTVFGFLLGFLGFLLGIYIVCNALSGNPVQGWSSTILAVVLTGAVQMIMLGVVGEYLWRNLDETRKRPLYFIERSYHKETEHAAVSEDNP